MKVGRKSDVSHPMALRAAELSAKFAEMRWEQSTQNFQPLAFVTYHGPFWVAAGAPPGRSYHAKACQTEQEIIDFLNSFADQDSSEPKPAEPVDADLTAAAPLTVDTPDAAIIVNEATEGPKEYPETDPREEELERLRAERDAEKAAREAAEKRLAELEARDAPVGLPPNPSETKLSDYGEVGEDADLEPDHLLDFMRADKSEDMADTGDIIAKLSSAKRKRFTELLNVELAELQQMRGAAGENLTRETEIEKLLGLFARVGEM